MSKINLLELCLSPSLGGLELYMFHTAKALDNDFNLFSVVALGSQLEPYFRDTKYRYVAIKHKGKSSILSAIKLARIIDEKDIDIVHMHWTNDLPTVVMARLFAKKKFKLVQSRHMHMTRFKNDMYHRFLYKQMSMILPVTQQVQGQINRFIPEDIRPKVEVLYPGANKAEPLDINEIDLFRQRYGMDKSFSIGMIGRIEEEKGQYLLINAVEKLLSRGVVVQAFFIGNPTKESYLDQLKSDVAQRSLATQIHFLGFMQNPQHFMQACDTVVLATPCETFGLVLIEAMQVGTTVVATNACGPLEIIDNGKNGLLFEKQSSDDLADKINLLAEDKALKEQMALEGEKKAEEQFLASKQFQKLSSILQAL